MTDINKSLLAISNNYKYYDNEFNKSGMATFNSYNPTKFSQIIRIFGNTKLNNITPGECDYAFNTLFKDIQLYKLFPNIWRVFAEHLCDAIVYITQDLSIDEVGYRLEYARFMNEREKYRNIHEEAHKYVSLYNKHVINWRFKSNIKIKA